MNSYDIVIYVDSRGSPIIQDVSNYEANGME